jgi:putative PIN family toxin of toxin-antitoxin system
MKESRFFVFDTNALISAALIKNSVNAIAFDHAITIGKLALSTPLLTEFTEVLLRPKFDRYFSSLEDRLKPIWQLEKLSISFNPVERITTSKDPDDNMILELAVAAKAKAIVSGDPHLLSINPFRGIPIVSASVFLKMF